MRRKRKIKLKYKKERVLLSDVLPYELPLIMSNRMLYRFCVKNKIQYSPTDARLTWRKNIDDASFEVIKLLFKDAFLEEGLNKTVGKAKCAEYSTIPFTFHILHKESDFRALNLVHPAMQIGMVDFYDKYKDLMLLYCKKSNYSIRYPNKVASFFFYKDKLHHTLLGKKRDNIELFVNEYENLKTFFSYRKYTQIYRFYDDFRFQRAEKRFSHWCKFDLQRCFNSIYTHTMAWATQGGKDAYKQIFKGKDKTSFGGRFDTIMQRLNHNETNGIVIGPEFSRIFAEIILQYIDRSVENQLLAKDIGLKNGKDYLLYRYVDDYFLFYNEEEVKKHVMETFHKELEVYKLSISEAKTAVYERPFITNISQAKIRIDRLISDRLKFRPNVASNLVDMAEPDEDKDCNQPENEEPEEYAYDEERIRKILSHQGYYPSASKQFNLEYKDILASVGVAPKDILNYTLSCVFTRLERELKKFDKDFKYIKLSLQKSSLSDTLRKMCEAQMLKMERRLTQYLIDVVDLSFFLFALCRRLNTSLKLMRILNAIIIYLQSEYEKEGVQRFSNEMKETVFHKIYIEVLNILSRERCNDFAQLEVLYLLIIMRMIGSKYAISPQVLEEYTGLDKKNGFCLNAISVYVLLYYMGNRNRYSDLKGKLVSNVLRKIKDKGTDYPFTEDSEFAMLAIDLVCCPYLSNEQKTDILNEMNLGSSVKRLLAFAKHNNHMFVKWTNINVTKELAAKISQEVYA